MDFIFPVHKSYSFPITFFYYHSHVASYHLFLYFIVIWVEGEINSYSYSYSYSILTVKSYGTRNVFLCFQPCHDLFCFFKIKDETLNQTYECNAICGLAVLALKFLCGGDESP